MAPAPAGRVDHARTEIRHESQLRLGRLNALLSCQAFLMIAYATSLGSSRTLHGHVADRRRNGDRFAMRTSVIFMGAWAILAMLPIWLFPR